MADIGDSYECESSKIYDERILPDISVEVSMVEFKTTDKSYSSPQHKNLFNKTGMFVEQKKQDSKHITKHET